MENEIANVIQAVSIASNPTQQDKSLQSQAVNYLAQVQQSAQGDEVWKLALKIFVETNNSATERKFDPQTRLFALRLLDSFLDSR
jgi:exportin-T